MPMRLNEPTRPHRLWSASPECRRYTSGPGILFIPFGLVFSLAGFYVLWACVWTVLNLFGIVAGHDGEDLADGLLRALGLLVIGSAFVIAGSILLWTLRSTLDRARDLVVVRSGWFGIKCRRRRLSEFRSVAVLPSRNLVAAGRNGYEFDIALLDESGAAIVVGYVSRSHDLALHVADEISEFTHLPVTTSRPAAAPPRQLSTGVP